MLLQCKKKYAAIVEIKSQLGFSWDDGLGANIGPADAASVNSHITCHNFPQLNFQIRTKQVTGKYDLC